MPRRSFKRILKMGKISVLTKRHFILPLFLFGLMIVCFAGPNNPSINTAITEFEPALAVRASACITCHAKIHPSYITDFGFGDSYFFGNPSGGAKFGSFDGHIYGDFYGGEPNKTGWLTAEIGKRIIVPQAGFNFDLKAAGSKLDKSNYQEALQSTSLAQYLQALENRKTKPASVIEKKRIFIGAPDAETIETRFGMAHGTAEPFKYIKNDSSSPGFSGIGLNSRKEFYTNTQEILCDGDLLVRGTLFLNHATFATKNGCRIYATGPIFVQNGVAYKNLGGQADNTNLQLVSAQAILLGVGDKSCDATSTESPLSRRLVSGYAVSTFMTRTSTGKSISPQELGKSIYAQGKLIVALEDAGCHDDTIGFTRLLLNAPQIHSRYKGAFKGLVIAEFALFRLSKGNFEFDPVFKAVPVLPRLKDSDYLQIQ
jgi:hypothetical protein